MTEATFPSPGPPPAGSASVFAQLTSFDRLIGARLVKLTYYIGLVAIALAAVVGLFSALAAMAHSVIGGLGVLLGLVISVVISTLIWRFSCELAILAFLAVDRLGEIRDRLPPR